MRKLKFFVIMILALSLLTACGAADDTGDKESEVSNNESLTFTDALGYDVTVESWDRVVSLYGSFAETWILAGGSIVGTTSDAVEERGLELGDNVAIVGTVKEPNLEEILAAEPDFVILSADIAAQADFHDALVQAGVVHAYYRVDTFDEYLSMLRQFCDMTGRDDLYEENGASIQKEIDDILEAVKDEPSPTVLLVRAYSTGAKAKGDDNLAGVILSELGADNLVTRYESLLEEISMEEIIAADPDYIFVTTMGSEDEAIAFMEENFVSDPAWAGLSAVENGRYIILPKELFQYKPNARWGESYAYIAEILYPEAAAEVK